MPTTAVKNETTVTCPRCGQRVELTRGNKEKIKPHRDVIVRAPCPAAGHTVDGARQWVNEQRARVGLLPLRFDAA